VHRHPSIAELCYLEKGEQSYRVDGSFLGLPEADGLVWRTFLCSPSKRVFHPQSELRSDFETILYADSISPQAAGTRVLGAVLSILLALKDSATAVDERPLSREIAHCLADIRRSLHQPLHIGKLATACSLSVSRFETRFREETGLAPGEYQLKLRMQQAKHLLSETDMRIIDIALEMGYSSSQHFASVFKRASGTSPSEWRRTCPAAQSAYGADSRTLKSVVLKVNDMQEIPPLL
jgi:AraC-like DNA-binding protein